MTFRFKLVVFFMFLMMTGLGIFANSHDANGFIEAARQGDFESMQSYVDANGDVNAVNRQGTPAIYAATVANRPDVIKWLLDLGALVDQPVPSGSAIDPTAILYAGAHGYTECVKVLLTANPDHSILNQYGGNALIPAAEKGHVDTVKLLLESSNVDIDHVNHLGWTALMEAVLLSKSSDAQIEIVRLLLLHGADQNIADNNGISVLEHARRRGLGTIEKLLAQQ